MTEHGADMCIVAEQSLLLARGCRLRLHMCRESAELSQGKCNK